MAKNIDKKLEITPKEEEYLQIYHEYFVLRWRWVDICRYHNCSKGKVSAGIKWVIKNRLEFPSKHLIKGAIDAIRARLSNNQILYEKEVKKKRYRDNVFIISLSKEIREDEKSLYRLEEIYGNDNAEDSLSAGQVLRLIKAASNKEENIEETDN